MSGFDGTCGTCGGDAVATEENEGYSDCCNDRIEYGDEALVTKKRIAAERDDEMRLLQREIAERYDGIAMGVDADRT